MIFTSTAKAIILFIFSLILTSCAKHVFVAETNDTNFEDSSVQTDVCETEIEQDEQFDIKLPVWATQSPEDFTKFINSAGIEQQVRVDLDERFLSEFRDYQTQYYDELFMNPDEPASVVSDIFEFLDGCVGGNYIFGAQGHLVNRKFVEKVAEQHPDYMDSGRLEYFLEIAQNNEVKDTLKFPEYPYDYAWDCSGLWWDCCNSLGLYKVYTDRTANATYEDFCIPIEKEELMPGDLVFFRGRSGIISHMGIMGEDGYIYEAASGFVGVVKQQSLDVRIYKDLVRGGYLIFPTWNEYGRPILYQ